MQIRIILDIFEKKKKQIGLVFFFLQTSRCDSNEQPCLKVTGLYDYLLFLSSLFLTSQVVLMVKNLLA